MESQYDLLVCKGNVHGYLMTNIDYTNKEYVKFTMYDFIEDILKEASKDMNGLFPWPTGNKIFKVNHESIHLSEVHADFFCIMTAQLLLECKIV